MVDLEDLDLAREGRAAQREAVHAGADDHVLASAAADGLREDVLGVAGAQDDGPVGGVGAQERVELLGAGADRLPFLAEDQPIRPRVLDQHRPVMTRVGRPHQRRPHRGPARPPGVHGGDSRRGMPGDARVAWALAGGMWRL